MPKYISDVDRWLSHENREVKAGEEFETTFPAGPGGKPMQLGDSLHLVKGAAKTNNLEPTVSDLKAELDALNIEYRGNAKKADLVKLLAEDSNTSTDESTDDTTDESTEDSNTSTDDLV